MVGFYHLHCFLLHLEQLNSGLCDCTPTHQHINTPTHRLNTPMPRASRNVVVAAVGLRMECENVS